MPGVGTQGDPVLKILGNAFGDGIAEPIVRGYTFLSRSYQDGDEIFITGFSRGATAARALAGMVAVRGLLDKTKYNTDDKTGAYLRAAAAWYLYRKPNNDIVDQERLKTIGGTAAGAAPDLTDDDFVAPPLIRAVGVFDTVSSLGLPLIAFAGKTHFDFSICDTTLNPDIQHGFHALAADETRDLFSPTFWAQSERVVQKVFPGCHSDVGGGFAHRGLSDGALDWMFAQLETAGLSPDRSRLVPSLNPDHLAPAQDDAATFPFKFTPRSSRGFPENATPSAPLLARHNQLTEMLPAIKPIPYKPIGTYADGSALMV